MVSSGDLRNVHINNKIKHSAFIFAKNTPVPSSRHQPKYMCSTDSGIIHKKYSWLTLYTPFLNTSTQYVPTSFHTPHVPILTLIKIFFFSFPVCLMVWTANHCPFVLVAWPWIQHEIDDEWRRQQCIMFQGPVTWLVVGAVCVMLGNVWGSWGQFIIISTGSSACKNEIVKWSLAHAEKEKMPSPSPVLILGKLDCSKAKNKYKRIY